jgi:hypothetical protein
MTNLALAHAPILLFDRAEPFLPSRVGFSVFRQPGDSRADYRRTLQGVAPLAFDLPGLDTVIEYGIWWDYDIQHLYELEAAWVYVDAAGDVLRVEASWHGGFHVIEVDGAPPLREGRPLLHSQPGKHAFAPSPEWFMPHERFIEPCRDRAGAMGLHVTPLFQGRITKAEGDDERVRAHLQRLAFTPAFVFDQEFPIGAEQLCPWPELEAWIPGRVAELAAALREPAVTGPASPEAGGPA